MTAHRVPQCLVGTRGWHLLLRARMMPAAMARHQGHRQWLRELERTRLKMVSGIAATRSSIAARVAPRRATVTRAGMGATSYSFPK